LTEPNKLLYGRVFAPARRRMRLWQCDTLKKVCLKLSMHT